LLYDGHGSTRQLTDNNGAIVTDQVYSYDAYGVSLGYTGTKDTNLLYAGEQFDTDAQQYYLRARYYSPSNGKFNRVDPFSGNLQDPQSLHKYLYTHCSPTNATDPTGRFTCLELLTTDSIRAIVNSVQTEVYQAVELSVRTTRSRGSINHAVAVTIAGNTIPFLIGPAVKLVGSMCDELFDSLTRRKASKILLKGRALLGLSDELSELYFKRTARDKYGAEAIGEIGAHFTAKQLGYKRVYFKKLSSDHGIDQIWRKGNTYITIEAKGGTGELAKGQMSKRWIRSRIKLLEKTNPRLVEKLEAAIDGNRMKGMVVRTKTKGASAFTPRFVLRDWHEIGFNTWSGRTR